MKTIVISQPMFFPWVGLFEQLRLADFFVHFDDVQLPRGRSFTNRVQIKTKDGSKWLTVPLKKGKSSDLIKDTYISYDADWRSDHLKFLESNYSKALFRDEMLGIVNEAYQNKFDRISELDIFALELVAQYFEIGSGDKFSRSSSYGFTSRKSVLLLDVISRYPATKYITGWGALNYLDYDLFESRGISVEFMDYQKVPYRQDFGDFDPFVSILDLIANEGKAGLNKIISTSKPWRIFKDERDRTIQ